MPKAEIKKPIGVPATLYNEMSGYAERNGLFLFEVAIIAWESLRDSQVSPEEARTLLYRNLSGKVKEPCQGLAVHQKRRARG